MESTEKDYPSGEKAATPINLESEISPRRSQRHNSRLSQEQNTPRSKRSNNTAASLVNGIYFKNNDHLPVQVINIDSDDCVRNVSFVAVKLT